MTPVDATNTLGQAQQAADGGGSVGRGLLAGGPGEGIGVACVDDQRLCSAARQHLATPQHRRGCRSVIA